MKTIYVMIAPINMLQILSKQIQQHLNGYKCCYSFDWWFSKEKQIIQVATVSMGKLLHLSKSLIALKVLISSSVKSRP